MAYGNYIKVKAPAGHPRADLDGQIFEHLLVAGKALGRPIPHGVPVHHVNLNDRDNRNRNLVICESDIYHSLLHARTNAKRREYLNRILDERNISLATLSLGMRKQFGRDVADESQLASVLLGKKSNNRLIESIADFLGFDLASIFEPTIAS